MPKRLPVAALQLSRVISGLSRRILQFGSHSRKLVRVFFWKVYQGREVPIREALQKKRTRGVQSGLIGPHLSQGGELLKFRFRFPRYRNLEVDNDFPSSFFISRKVTKELSRHKLFQNTLEQEEEFMSCAVGSDLLLLIFPNCHFPQFREMGNRCYFICDGEADLQSYVFKFQGLQFIEQL